MTPLMADHPSGAEERARRSSVKASLTPNRRRPVDNDKYASFVRRVIRATPGEWQPVMLTPWPA